MNGEATMPTEGSDGKELPHTSKGGEVKSGHIVRIATALGSFLVIIVNDLGPAADGLAREIESEVIGKLRAHRDLVEEMSTVDVQRGDLDLSSIQL
jgi:hypothetical protein